MTQPASVTVRTGRTAMSALLVAAGSALAVVAPPSTAAGTAFKGKVVAGEWTYRVTNTTVVHQGPSTRDRRIATFVKGKEISARAMTRRGQAVHGNPTWIAVETGAGNRGWISATNLHLVT